MALHRTTVTATAASLILLCGCDTLTLRQLDYDNTEAVTISRITVRPGSGDVTVRGSGPAGQVRVKRVVRYQGGQPDTRYEINGDELVLDTDCGPRCGVSYEVTAPEGVTVRGETGSGDVTLDRVGAVEFRLGSGNVRVTGARGDVRAETGSGDVTVELTEPASARVHTGSGDISLTVPEGRYRLRTSTGSGDADLKVTDDPSASLVLDLSTGSGDVTVDRS